MPPAPKFDNARLVLYERLFNRTFVYGVGMWCIGEAFHWF